jgi:GH43 family beta-xylosidase
MKNILKKFVCGIYPVIFSLVIFTTPACRKNSGSSGGNPPPEPPPTTEKTFSNPLLKNGPDPFVAQVGATYYYTNTLGNRIGIWKTNAMSKLSTATYTTIFTPPASGENSKNIWAPEFYFTNSKWYLYYTAGNGNDATQRTFVLENDNADPTQGMWVDKGRIYNSKEDFWAIDGTVLKTDSINYFIWSGRPDNSISTQNIYISKMANPTTLEGNRVMISTPQYCWEQNGSVNEGPEILKNPKGKTFLVYSASGCWTDEYGLGLLSLKDKGNPLVAADWTKSATPVFTKSVTNNVYGPGHNSFFKSPDGTEDWIIYHANPAPENGQGCGDTRSTRMQKFTWKDDGTPDFGVPVATNVAIKVPSGE